MLAVFLFLVALGPEPGTYSAWGGWARLLRSIGLVEAPRERAEVIEAAPGNPVLEIEAGRVLLLEGEARGLGFVRTTRHARVRRITDTHSPDIRITWKDAAEAAVFQVPRGARVFASAAGGRVPLLAGLARGRGAVLWTAIPPGTEGYERFPFLPQALAELGVRVPAESRRLWAFFDAGVRHGRLGDLDELAATWRNAGIAAVHIAVWDFFEPSERDRLIRDLIAACHRHLVNAYAWLELPHVSHRFWDEHPEWREKNARLQDAAVDWRLLMNLQNPACRDAVVAGVRGLLARFDWDGVNLAELYFDGIEGLRNRKEFTPLDDDVRRAFQAAHGADPITLFRGRRDPALLRAFLDFRADLSARLQVEWIEELEKIRAARPGLDVVLTHVDDRFDTTMHDALGADAARALRILDSHPVTFIIEDPATVWHLGPQRYAEIARRYAPLTAHHDRVGVDINVVDRGNRAHPTALQTGAELVELIHTAAVSFARVMVYCEATIDPLDLPLLAPASTVIQRFERQGKRLTIESPYGAGVRWPGAALVDGRPWPVQDGERVWVPAGGHAIEPAAERPALPVLDFNGELETASATAEGTELVYCSATSALALVAARPARLLVDGRETPLELIPVGGRFVLRLPGGAHRILLERAR